MVCPNCGNEFPDGTKYCPGCWTEIPEQPVLQPDVIYQVQPGMKWFKFLIYFSLFAGAVLNFFSGISLLTGVAYGDMADQIYEMFAGLRALDTMVGVATLGVAVLAIVTRFRLAKFCKNGPKLLIILYVVSAVITLLYIFGASVILSSVPGAGALDTSTQISGITSSAFMAVVNYIYFKKRRHLFIND